MHCRAILPSLCRHCQSKAKHRKLGAGYAFSPIKQVDLQPSDLEIGVTCDVIYLYANFSLPMAFLFST